MQRQFKGVWIPARIWDDHRMGALEKMLLAEIDSFTGAGSTYFKANETIATDLGTSLSSVRRAISKLKEYGLIKEVGFDGRRRHLVSVEHPEVSNVSMEGAHIEHADRPKVTGQDAPCEQLIIQPKNNPKKPNEIEWPEGWDDDRMHRAWSTWKEYKRTEWKFHYKSRITEQTTINKLHHETSGDLAHAIASIEWSISKNWKGIFLAERSPKRDAPADPQRALEWAQK